MSNSILVTNDRMDLATFANDDNIQVIILRDFFTESAKLASRPMSIGEIANITEVFIQANQTGNMPDTMGFSPEENEYAHIAINLKELLDYTAKIYTQKHGLADPRSTYSPKIQPNLETANCNQGIMEASTVLIGEYGWFSNYKATPEVGDLVIVKGGETTKQGNESSNLARYATNKEPRQGASMGISVIAMPS